MPAKKLYGIYGASGYGREVMPVARDHVRRHAFPDAELVFIDDAARVERVNGHRVLTYAGFVDEAATEKAVAIAIADPATRERLSERCVADGVAPFSLIAENVVIMDDVRIGDGHILSPFVTITSNATIGRHFHANIYSYVAHDCVIGDYVTFAPGVKCNGNVVVGDHAYLGTGAVLRQGKPGAPLVIGNRAVVGMGAVVTKDVPAGATVVGNPARPHAKK